MNGLFIFSVILGVVALACIVIGGLCWLKASDEDVKAGGIVGTVIGVVVGIGAVIAVLASSFNSVGTYDIGVTTSFGKVISYVGPGAHWIAPWENMSLMDESVQSVDYDTTVRLAQQQTANASVHLRVRVQPTATDALFKLYKGNTANVMSVLVTPKLNEAMSTVLGGYNPITPLSTPAAEGTPQNPTTAQLSQQIETTLNQEIGSQVQIVSLVLKPLDYDQAVDDRINSVITQTAQTDKAQEAIQTAKAQAAAYQQTAQTLAKNPMVLVKQCMDAISDGQLNPPAGFSCWPGQGSGIVIPSK